MSSTQTRYPFPEQKAEELRRTGILLQSPQALGDRVFFCSRGFRHWVRDAAWLADCGFRWPDDVVRVPREVLLAMRPGGPVARYWPVNVDPDGVTSSLDMREYMSSQLRGTGLEIGAGASPFPAPLDCRVLYGDQYTYRELVAAAYPGQEVSDIVVPDVRTNFDTFDGISDESLDFIIGCHVIEHTRNPIAAIRGAYRKLSKGGKLVLVVPDKERTFDRERPVTSLAHLIQDYQDPDNERDFQHYQEFYELAFPVPESHRAEVTARRYQENYSIHFHVWNYEAFRELIDYIGRHVCSWSNVWAHPALPNRESDIEFYFMLTK
jgi:SAM-dependent methyltransferase